MLTYFSVINMWLCKKNRLLHLDEKNCKHWAVGQSRFKVRSMCVKKLILLILAKSG
jgi:hypothetical protein